MKLICKVQVINKLLANTNARCQKPQQSCLAIEISKSDEIWLLHQTTTDKKGSKYKISNNVEKVFDKFICEGKATIRLKEPQKDIIIQSDEIQLKSFLRILFNKKLNRKNLSVLSTKSPKSLTLPKTKIIIKEAKDYPVLNGFSRITKELHLSGLHRKSFDRQILKLQNLMVLNLSENQLSSLPQELGSLPNLRELDLSDNLLGKTPKHKWSWLNGIHISKNLCSLNLNSNRLVSLPEQIGKLKGLKTLTLSNNYLTKLPQSIGSLSSLKSLNVGKNNLNFLPGSMVNLRLTDIDVSDNSFSFYESNFFNPQIKIPTLLDLAGQIVLKSRMYYDASIIPYTLVPYLDKANYCMCGLPCFESYTNTFMQISLNSFSTCVKTSNRRDIYFECFLCFKCFPKYSKVS